MIGPYRVVRTLGAGGMGVVYECRHLETGARVALKSVRVPAAGMLDAIRREIQGLRRLRHPGIVPIIDEGLSEGMPWYVMPMMPGRSLRELMPPPEEGSTERTPFASRPWRAQLAIVRDLCHPLRYLHGEGLVHRDLKPANILVRPDGTPLIIDFGLISQFAGPTSRAVLEVAGIGSGTLGYMAPEQIRGEPVDARSDIYALGCILYQLVTGRLPFVGQRAVVTWETLTRAPEPPSSFDPTIPEALDSLLLRLLAKQPRDRVGFADDLARKLESLGVRSAPGFDDQPVRPYLYRPTLAGRSTEVEQFGRRLGEMRHGEPVVLLLRGESGVGKTRLMSEIAHLAVSESIDVFVGECLPERREGLAGFRAILCAIGDRCRELGESETQRVFGHRSRVLQEYETSLSHLPGADRYPSPVGLEGEAGLRRVLKFATDVIVSACTRPTLLIIDDVQWADQLTLGVVAQLCRAARQRRARFLLLLSCRSEEPRAELDRLADRGELAALDLERVGRHEVGALAADMLALSELGEGFSRFLTKQSEGNPFFVAEYLRAAMEAEILRRENGVWKLGTVGADASEESFRSLTIPRSIEQLVLTHTERLSTASRLLLEAMAVWGREVRLEVLNRMVEVRRCDHEAALAELLRRHLLRQSDALAFEHDKLREIVYSRTDPGRRKLLHRRAAVAIEELPEEHRAPWLGVLGHHWRQAGALSRAREAFRSAAKSALKRFDEADARDHYQAYLELVETPTPESIEARDELGSLYWTESRLKEAEHQHRQALGEAEAIGDRRLKAAATSSLAMIRQRQGELEAAWDLESEALRTCQEIGDRLGEGRDLANLAMLCNQRGLLEDALEYGRRAVEIQRELGRTGAEAIALSNLAITNMDLGNVSDAEGQLAAALCIARDRGDRQAEARYLDVFAILRIRMGRIDEALEMNRRGLAIERELGNQRGEAHSLVSLANLQLDQGRLEEGRRLAEEALEMARTVEDRRLEGSVLFSLANCLQDLGELPDSLERYEQALAVFQAVGDRRFESVTLGAIAGNLIFTSPDLERAAQMATSACDQLEALGDAYLLAQIVCVRAHIGLAQGMEQTQALETARRIAKRIGVSEDSHLATVVAKLERAQTALGSPGRLVCGYLLEDLSDGERRWVTRQKPGSASAPSPRE